MSENEQEQEQNPTWNAGAMDALESTIITIEAANQIADGINKWGEWNLWPVSVENVKVQDKGEKKPRDELYTGKAVCFPSDGLHKQFLKHTGGTKEGVKIKVTLVPKKGKKGFYTTFQTELVSDGATPENSTNVLDTHSRFLKDFKNFVDNNIVEGTKEDFVNFAKSDTYKIPVDTHEKLWSVYNEGK